MKQVLVAYDGSGPSRRALAHAADLARPDDRVTVINVMHEPGVSARIEPPSEERYRQRQILEEAERFLAGHGIEARMLGPVGDAASEILAAAERIGADVLVIARRHRHMSHVLGSTSSRIVRSANCDVLVVHEGPPESPTAP